MPGMQKCKAMGPQVAVEKARDAASKPTMSEVQIAWTESRRTEVPGKSVVD